MQKPSEIALLSVKALLSDPLDYLIPLYQRNYAWGEGEISQLIQDVLDCAAKGMQGAEGAQGMADGNYYVGTLVVHSRTMDDGKRVWELIDGQQRFTTLSLLVACLRRQDASAFGWYERMNIRFESREASTHALQTIYKKEERHVHRQGGQGVAALDRDGADAIWAGLDTIGRELRTRCAQAGVSRQVFARFLLERVQLLRVEVPEDTDLNHYFEIMNNRGEQLEKHEVLKARLLDKLNHIQDLQRRQQSTHALHTVWEACANMDKYVQSGFTPVQRDQLFGADWQTLMALDFDQLLARLEAARLHEATPSKQSAPAVLTGAEAPKNGFWELESIIELLTEPAAASNAKKDTDDDHERFHAVINFPNFLLQVLNVVQAASSSAGHKEAPLDDKQLLQTFDSQLLGLETSQAISEIEKFTHALLRCRFLFDQYVIKRDRSPKADNWSLMRCKKSTSRSAYYVSTFSQKDNEEQDEPLQRRVLMLLAAFHVSAPSQPYKYWVNGALRWLFAQNAAEPIQLQDYLFRLESLARAFVFDLHLSAEKMDYATVLGANRGECQTILDASLKLKIAGFLRYGEIRNNLVFNYLDYLLHCKFSEEKKDLGFKFAFTFRSSVEHFYPQKPFDGFDPWDADDLNSFGNLCLISHSKNSRLGNLDPTAKINHFKAGGFDSLKQYAMVGLMKDGSSWSAEKMKLHEDDMLCTLLASLKDPAGLVHFKH